MTRNAPSDRSAENETRGVERGKDHVARGRHRAERRRRRGLGLHLAGQLLGRVPSQPLHLFLQNLADPLVVEVEEVLEELP